jgi:hypothetical protein
MNTRSFFKSLIDFYSFLIGDSLLLGELSLVVVDMVGNKEKIRETETNLDKNLNFSNLSKLRYK